MPLLLGADCLGPDAARPPDRAPPSIQVLSPIDSQYDQDSDRLVDVKVLWHDSLGAVAFSKAQVTSMEGVAGSVQAGANLITVWRVERLDAGGLTLHETRANLLHPGLNHLVLLVPDTSGNVLTDTVAFTLPYAAFIKTIPSGLQMGVQPAAGITICSDDNLLYMTAGISLVIADPDSLKTLAAITDPAAFDALDRPLCIPGDPILYVTLRVERFNRSMRQWLPTMDSTFGSIGITQSKANPDLLYVGETTTGTIGLISRALDRRTGYLLSWFPGEQELVHSVVVLSGDTKLYMTEAQAGGILVVDPQKDSALRRIPIGGPEYAAQGDSGDSQDMVLSQNGQHIYAAVDLALHPGLVDINTQVDSVVRSLSLFNYYAIGVALSSDEKRAFVTTQDNGSPSENVLVDISNWSVLQTLPRPRAPGETRFDRAVTFNAQGTLIFVTHNVDIDVYLNRE